jgi:uncharacterized protein (TIGR02594 family)
MSAETKPVIEGAPGWMKIALQFWGLHEAPGSADNSIILGWAAELGGWIGKFYMHDSIPWCGLFVAVCMVRVGVVLPVNPLGALNWLQWGVPLGDPCVGAIMVFRRDGGGHVAMYVGEDETSYHVLGGNQGDQVDVTSIGKDRCAGFRWPAGVPLPTTGRVQLAAGGVVSKGVTLS